MPGEGFDDLGACQAAREVGAEAVDNVHGCGCAAVVVGGGTLGVEDGDEFHFNGSG